MGREWAAEEPVESAGLASARLQHWRGQQKGEICLKNPPSRDRGKDELSYVKSKHTDCCKAIYDISQIIKLVSMYDQNWIVGFLIATVTALKSL